MKRYGLLVCFLVVAIAIPAVAQTATTNSAPPLIKFSGVIPFNTGAPLGVTFALYKDQTGGAPLWLETQNVAVDSAGRYTIYLGATHAGGVPPELFADGEARWLGVQPQGQPEQPRVLLAAVPYAMKAVNADTLGGLPAAAYVSSAASPADYKALVQTIVEQVKDSGALAPFTATAGATNFSDTTTNQVVGVTQLGTGKGISATTPSGQTIYASNTATAGTAYAVYATAASPSGRTIYAANTATTGTVYAVYATSASPAAISIRGTATSTTGSTRGVQGNSSSTSGVAGYFEATATSGTTYGVQAVTDSPSGYGIYGIGPVNGMKAVANNTTGVTTGFIGTVNSAQGIAAIFNNNAGGQLASFRNAGVQEALIDAAGDFTSQGVVTGKTLVSTVATGTAPLTVASATVVPNLNATYLNGLASSAFQPAGSYATLGANAFTASQTVTSATAGTTAVSVQATGTTTANTAVSGLADGPNGTGLSGEADNGSTAVGVYGESSSGLAALFSGNVQVTGNVSKAGGSFQIDHPLDPANKYLYHSFVESPDMKNIYDGMVVLDEKGEAWIALPDWFQALNRDFRYQLTSIGAFMPVYVAEELANNRFKIAGGQPGGKVSWQVTGIRQDAWANAHRIPTEVEKTGNERGKYLHPELYGAPKEDSVVWDRLHGKQ
jgi:hypothetical protein